MLPYIKVQFEGDEITRRALIDTGSEVTVLHSELAEKIKDKAKFVMRKTSKISIDGVTGNKKHTGASNFASMVTMFGSEGEEVDAVIDGIVLDISTTINAMNNTIEGGNVVMIIGSDTLTKLKAKIDYKKKSIVFNDLLCLDKGTEKSTAGHNTAWC